MTSSIIEESKKSKRNRAFGFMKNKKFIYTIVAVVIMSFSAYFFIGKDDDSAVVAKLKNWTVKQGDIVQSVESDGKVVAKDGVELSFSVSGDSLEVDEVYIKEGDKIKKGDKIASVKTETLNFNLRNAWSSYQSALADFNETMDGASEEDVKTAKDRIISAQISLDQAKISLENTKQNSADDVYNKEQVLKDAKDNLADNQNELTSEDVKDAYENLVENIKSINISLESILDDSDEIVGVDNEQINDDFEKFLGAKDVSSLNIAKGTYNFSKDELKNLSTYALSINIHSPYSEIEEASAQAEKTLEAFEKHLYDMKVLLDASITSSALTQTELNSFISSINANRTSVNTKISTLNAKISAVETAIDGLDDYLDGYNDALRALTVAQEEAERDLKNSEANVSSKELTLDASERNHEDVIAPLTDAELASARSRLTSASISLEKTQFDLEKSILESPIDGELVELNYAPGDIIITNDNRPMAVIINNDTLFIEVNIEEADISKLTIGQRAYATFDALDELELEGEVSFISLTSKTNNNGIVTYLVRVIFTKGEHQIREGMTAYIDFVSQEVRDVLLIPVESVRNVQGKPSVQNENGEWLAVTTGFTDGKMVEVIFGLNVGDKLLY